MTANLDKMYVKAQALRDQLRQLEAEIAVGETEARKTVTVVKRQASNLYLKQDGTGFMVGAPNRYNEKKIYRWDGKKGELVGDGVRAGINDLRLAIALKSGMFA